VSNLDMNTDVFALRLANGALRGTAACLGATGGILLLVASTQALLTRVGQVEAVSTWCKASKGCVSLPSTLGSSILSVQENKAREASELVNGMEGRAQSFLVNFPAIEVVAVARGAQKDQQRQKGRQAAGGSSK
jgi:hypothetical protein